MYTNQVPQIIKFCLNGVQVAPFGPKLGQNDAPDLRIIFQALLGPKIPLKNKKIQILLRVGGMRRSLVNYLSYVEGEVSYVENHL